MKYLITGNTGYVGSVLVKHLLTAAPNLEIDGYDSGFFAHCLTGASRLPETRIKTQYWGDVREFPENLLSGVDVVIHLAAVSNDPMGNRFEKATEAINYHASVDIAKKAKRQGVKSFVFASSCSIYGFTEGGTRKESDVLNPLTAYAKAKVNTEKALSELGDDDFIVTALRFSTACGMSDRLRLDLVLNDFVASAIATGQIIVLSDGTPWRPLINVSDMARAIEWASERKTVNGGNFLCINIGSEKWNYQVKDLAKAVAAAVEGTRVNVNENAQPDKRSYKVDFSLFRRLAPDHQPIVGLEETIEELKLGLEKFSFYLKNFRETDYMRLKVLENHIKRKYVDENLFWH